MLDILVGYRAFLVIYLVLLISIFKKSLDEETFKALLIYVLIAAILYGNCVFEYFEIIRAFEFDFLKTVLLSLLSVLLT